MRKLGLFAVGGLVIGWGGFMLLMAPTDGIPPPLLWLGAVIALAFTLAAAAARDADRDPLATSKQWCARMRAQARVRYAIGASQG